jgi:hypothetical protein
MSNTVVRRLLAGVLLLSAAAPLPAQDETPVQKRTPYPIPLARLSVSFDAETNSFEKVRVRFGEDPSYASITRYNDLYVKVSRTANEKQVFPESPDLCYQLSTFEANQLDQVCRTLVQTLRQFEENLQRQRWDRCLYLDGYLPRFLKGFYYLYCGARNSASMLPRFTNINDSLYESSLSSPKSDARINRWRSREDYVTKLRIAVRELVFQTEEWRKKELGNPRRNRDMSYGSKFEDAYALFVRMYFDLPAPATTENYW